MQFQTDLSKIKIATKLNMPEKVLKFVDNFIKFIKSETFKNSSHRDGWMLYVPEKFHKN